MIHKILTTAGFEYFDSAQNAENEFFGCRTKLAIEYSRLQRWAVRSCLVDESTRPIFESRTKHTRYVIIAILTQLDRKLKDMRKVMLEYEDTIDDEKRKLLDNVSTAFSEARPSLNDVSEVKVTGISVSVDEILNYEPTLVESIPSEEELQRFNSLTDNASGILPAVNTMRGFRHMAKWSKGAIKIGKQPKRCRWAFADKSKFEGNLAEVRELVNGLIATLEQDQMEQVMRDVRDIRLVLLATVRSAAGAQVLRDVTQESSSDNSRGQQTHEADGDTLVADSVSLSAMNVPASVTAERAFNDFYQKVTSFFIAITSGDTEDSRLKVSRLEYDKTAESSMLWQDTLLDGQPAWIEWKSYTSVTGSDKVSGKPTSGPSAVVEERARRLGSLLINPKKPMEFCVPPFAGIFKDSRNCRFGFVYKAPNVIGELQGANSIGRVSLEERLQGAEATLFQRVEMAQQLSQWLLYLHCISWLHKNIRSESIMFFAGKDMKTLSHLYVTGFEYARLENSLSISESTDPKWERYSHPDYVSGKSSGFRKTYDMYSLGLVLVELAYWKPIGQIFPTEKPEGIRECLFNQEKPYLDHVEAVMGKKYASATRACLEGMAGFGLRADRDQGEPVISGLLQQAFIRMIVNPLHEIAV